MILNKCTQFSVLEKYHDYVFPPFLKILINNHLKNFICINISRIRIKLKEMIKL